MALKVGICGVGRFAPAFIPLFQNHPGVKEVYLADLCADRLAQRAAQFGVRKTFPGLDELCASDCDCIALFTQRWLHGPQAVQALKAGKHVYSAVPAAVTLEELAELVDTVKSTGLVYMLGETSYYRVQTHYCRERFAKGDFGDFVYGEGQYHHDMAHFYGSYMFSGRDAWKATASFPPMLYPTHSVAFILGVTFRRMTEVCCFGFEDHHPDGVFNADLSQWHNTFSNETALFRTSDGGMARVNEFRRTGAGGGRMTIVGTAGAYEEQQAPVSLSAVWTWLDFPPGYAKGGEIPYGEAAKAVKLRTEDISQLHVFKGVELTEENIGNRPRKLIGKRFLGISEGQPYQRLPDEFVEMPNGHEGVHVFLVHDFVTAAGAGKLPPNHVWLAARYNAPGIVAHESAKRGGELMKVPDFGLPPKDRPTMDITYPLQP